ITGIFDSVDPATFEPGHFYNLNGMVPGYQKNRENTVDTWAAFVENRLQLTERLSLLTGLRYDHIDLDVHNYRTVDANNPLDFQRSYEPTTGRIGLVYELTPAANVYVQYSTAADPPSGM
ncbi:TonB-dependent receptor, partial [Pseudomonas frederiksbergensis]|nr:TonB-dependent receptor [Pseudomonas frederiksbergensis]